MELFGIQWTIGHFILILALIVWIVNWISQRFISKSKPDDATNDKVGTKQSLKKLQKELTTHALHVAHEFGFDLDFSHDSVKDVERVLALLHKEYKRAKHLDGLHGLALEFGAYIITTMEKQGTRGVWRRDDEDMGKDTFPYQLEDGSTIFPYHWCIKRIIDGPGDDVWSKYHAIVLKGLDYDVA